MLLLVTVFLFLYCVPVSVLGKSHTLYDKNINVFSDKGELLQVEYATNAGREGASLYCARSEEGDVILCIPASPHGDGYDQYDTLLDTRSIDKVAKVDDSVYMAFSGLPGDGRTLIKLARSFSVEYYKKFYCEPGLQGIANYIGTFHHSQTTNRGTRPFGVQVVLVGFNEESRAYEISQIIPSGEVTAWKALAMGRDADKYMRMLENRLNKVSLPPLEELLDIMQSMEGDQEEEEGEEEEGEEEEKQEEEEGGGGGEEQEEGQHKEGRSALSSSSSSSSTRYFWFHTNKDNSRPDLLNGKIAKKPVMKVFNSLSQMRHFLQQKEYSM